MQNQPAVRGCKGEGNQKCSTVTKNKYKTKCIQVYSLVTEVFSQVDPRKKKTTNQQKRNFYSGSLIVLFKYSHFCKCKCNFPSLVAMCFSSFMWSTTIFRNFSVVGNFFPDLHRKIVYFIKIIKLFTYFDLIAFPEIPPNISFHSVFLNSCISKWLIKNSHNDFTLSHCKNKCKYVSHTHTHRDEVYLQQKYLLWYVKENRI